MTFSRFFAAFILTVWALIGTTLHAQEIAQPNYDAWGKLAGQAEQILQSGNANNARLEEIRAEVVKWRERFGAAEGTNATRIATMKDQIAALGPVPAEGQTESEDLAARRKALNDELAELKAPGLNAVEAYGRADGIIQQIDRAQRERQTNALLRDAPSPLNPVNWAPAVQDGITLLKGLTVELNERWHAQNGWSAARVWGPKVFGLLVLAGLLLTWGRRWILSAPSRLSARASERVRAVVVFAASLGQIAIPLIGVILLIIGIFATDLPGPWLTPILRETAGAALLFYAGLWLVRWLFVPGQGGSTNPPLAMGLESQRKAALASSALAAVASINKIFSGAILPLSGFLNQPEQLERVPMNFSDGAAAVWHYPLILLGSYFLFRLGNVLRGVDSERPEGDSDRFRMRIVSALGAISRVVALISVCIATVGYISLANAMLWPWAMTLALIALLILMQDFIADLYAMAKGGEKAARDALMPMIIGFMLILVSLPLFALIWGARTAELTEYWTRLRQGVSVGGVTISPTGILSFIVIFVIGYFLTRFIQGGLRSTVLPKTKIDAGGRNAIVSGVGYLGIILAVVLAITGAGIDLTSLAFIAGALSLGIGFGLQNIVSNFVSGIILLIERPIAEGDWIQVGAQQGIVKRISVRSTHVQTFDRTEIIVPNSDLVQQPVTNWTRGNLTGRIVVPVSVAYGTDTRKVEKILREIAEDQPTVLINPPPAVMFRSFGADGLDFEIRAVLSDINGGVSVTSEINHEIARRFGEAGIEIPFQQRDLWLRNPETLNFVRRNQSDKPEDEPTASDDKGEAPA